MPDNIRLSTRELASLSSGRPADREACPTSDELSSMLEPDGRVARARFAEHVASCGACGEEWSVGLELRRELGVDAGAATPRGWASAWLPSGGAMRRWAVGFAALAVVAVGSLVVRERVADPPAVRGGEGEAATVEPADGARLAAPPERFTRRDAASSARWRVELFDAESAPIWASPLVSGPVVELPGEVRGRLVGRTYWRIVELDGARENRSKLMRFDVVP